jgi:hypothetical protein
MNAAKAIAAFMMIRTEGWNVELIFSNTSPGVDDLSISVPLPSDDDEKQEITRGVVEIINALTAGEHRGWAESQIKDCESNLWIG